MRENIFDASEGVTAADSRFPIPAEVKTTSCNSCRFGDAAACPTEADLTRVFLLSGEFTDGSCATASKPVRRVITLSALGRLAIQPISAIERCDERELANAYRRVSGLPKRVSDLTFLRVDVDPAVSYRLTPMQHSRPARSRSLVRVHLLKLPGGEPSSRNAIAK